MRSLIFCLGFLFLFTISQKLLLAQPADSVKISLSPEIGFYAESADGFMGFKISTRLQPQVDFTAPISHNEPVQPGFSIRRARARIHGYFYEKKLVYFLQIQMDQGSMMLSNAELRWKPSDNLKLNIGQLWPAAGRQFRTVSDVFQMIDRSPVARFFSPGYDIGAAAQYNFNTGKTGMVKSYFSITHGEGMNMQTAPGGLAYTGRIELLPFGDFTNSGDYVESDIYREKSPKLSVGAALYHNRDAYRLIGGEAGSEIWESMEDNITALYLDAVYKYNGFSLLAEYASRSTDNEIIDQVPTPAHSLIAGGNGFSAQAGKFIAQKTEPTFRISLLNPNDELRAAKNQFTRQNSYTAGMNYFLRGHAIKLQFELGFFIEEFQNTGTRTYLNVLSQLSFSF